MGFLNFYHFLPILDPFLAFGCILGQFPIYCHMCIYKLCNHVKNALINGISMDIFNFYHFLPILDPFTLFWPFVIFWVNFLYIVICAYINFVFMQKIAHINGISLGIFIFIFYHFFTYLGHFFTVFWSFVIFWVNFL